MALLTFRKYPHFKSGSFDVPQISTIRSDFARINQESWYWPRLRSNFGILLGPSTAATLSAWIRHHQLATGTRFVLLGTFLRTTPTTLNNFSDRTLLESRRPTHLPGQFWSKFNCCACILDFNNLNWFWVTDCNVSMRSGTYSRSRLWCLLYRFGLHC